MLVFWAFGSMQLAHNGVLFVLCFSFTKEIKGPQLISANLLHRGVIETVYLIGELASAVSETNTAIKTVFLNCDSANEENPKKTHFVCLLCVITLLYLTQKPILFSAI